jgi:hypothetical protein
MNNTSGSGSMQKKICIALPPEQHPLYELQKMRFSFFVN